MSNSKYLVYIEGNIASGKSSLIQILKNEIKENIECYSEPIDKWTNLEGKNLLKEMYIDPKNKSFTLQTYIQLTMAQIQMANQTKPVKITERSLMSERFVFIENLFRNELLNETETEILSRWFQFLSKQIPRVNEIIYLQTSPETSFRRLQSRNRAEESSVTLDYIKQIHELYEEWLVKKSMGNLDGIKIRIINQNLTFDELRTSYQEIINDLRLTSC